MTTRDYTCLFCNDIYEFPGPCPDCGAELMKIHAIDYAEEMGAGAREELIMSHGIEIREAGE